MEYLTIRKISDTNQLYFSFISSLIRKMPFAHQLGMKLKLCGLIFFPKILNIELLLTGWNLLLSTAFLLSAVKSCNLSSYSMKSQHSPTLPPRGNIPGLF